VKLQGNYLGEDVDDETNNDDKEENAIIKKVDRHFNTRSKVADCLVSELQIGLLCSTTSPHEGLPTNDFFFFDMSTQG
jgi:hypothetical protein